MIVVRFADDFVVGFEHREDGEQFLSELEERLKRFGLELHSQKTRLIEFGRQAEQNRQSRGEGKPETFNFLGFTHSCAKTRKGRFVVRRQTMRQRWQRKLKEVKAKLKQRITASVPEMGQYVRSVIVGHMYYYAVPMNAVSVSDFRMAVGRIWWRILRRRSQKARVSRTQMERRVARWLPLTRACVILIPGNVLALLPKARAGCSNAARPDPWRGLWATMIPTPTIVQGGSNCQKRFDA